MNKFLLIAILAILQFGVMLNAEGTIDDALAAYQDTNLTKARRIAKENLKKPLACLIYNLCLIHDSKAQDLKAGLAGLKKIYSDNKIEKKVRIEALMSYARVIQLLQARGRHLEFQKIDTITLLKQVIKEAPNSIEACQACIYLAEHYMHGEDKKGIRQSFKFVESFLKSYKGPAENTVMVHLYIEKFYIVHNADYKASYRHLKRAYDLGIRKEALRETVLFRMGRISDIKLRKKALAKKYYREFLVKYKHASRTPVVKRYLKTIK